jgi:hypothetical protein
LRIAAISFVALLLAGAIFWAAAVGPLRSPDAAFADFLASEGRAEDQLTDPLVLSGRRVAPRVLAEVKDPDLKHRRYAIGFLGCLRYAPAVEVFRSILANPEEKDYFRGDALEAIWLTAPQEGIALAKQHSSATGHLGDVARNVVSGTREPYCRSWWQAFRGTHD